MLNHLQKYEGYELFKKTDAQQLSYAFRKDQPSQPVIINQIKKSALLLPIDVHGLINAFRQMDMLEEDGEHWYIITRRLEGQPLFPDSHKALAESPQLSTDQLYQFLNLVADYDGLAAYYQYLLLSEELFQLHNGQVKSSEVLLLESEPSIPMDFVAVKARIHQLLGRLIALLKISEPHTYETVNWMPIFERSAATASLSALVALWKETFEALGNKLKPTPLKELYVVSSAEAAAPAAQRRQAEAEKRTELESLQAQSAVRPKGVNPAIWLTLVLALALLAIFVLPGLLKQASPENDTAKTDSPSTSAPAEAAPGTSAPDTASPAPKGDDIERLPADKIAFLNGKWAYDENQFYSGNQSLKLVLSTSDPLGTLRLSPVALSKNTSFNFWMMSDTSGQVQTIVSFYEGDHLIQSFENVTFFEAPMTWYLINPLSGANGYDLTKADSLEIKLLGSSQTLWLDDLALESFK